MPLISLVNEGAIRLVLSPALPPLVTQTCAGTVRPRRKALVSPSTASEAPWPS